MAEGRVLQVLGPSTGGIRRVVAALTIELERRGWDVVTMGPAGVLDGLVHQDAVLGAGALRRLARDVDVVHAHGLKVGWMAAGVHPLVTTVHNVVLGRNPVLRLMERHVPGDRLIATSSEVAARFVGRAVTLIPPAAAAPVPSRSPEVVRAAYGIAPDERLLVAVARLHPQKDLPTLFRAVEQLDRVRLVVVGEGPDEAALRAQAPPSVVFAGQRPSAADELAAADVVVISSMWESGPLVLFEALQLGRPVVSTAVGAAPDLLDHVVPVGDADALAAAISAALDAPVLAAGRALGPEHMASAVDALYRDIMRPR
jgi:glycosyltransferase involved in cell wall biosynthesis